MDEAFRTVVLDSAFWAVWGTVIGLVLGRAPARWFSKDNFVTRIRHFERSGRIYQRLGIRRWKDRVPELGELFGGQSKRRLPLSNGTGRRLQLVAFSSELRRAELVHWLVMAGWFVLPLWNSAPWLAVMAAYSFLANAPFIAIQRYNRARIARIIT